MLSERDFRARARAFREAFSAAFTAPRGRGPAPASTSSTPARPSSPPTRRGGRPRKGLNIDTASGGELAIALAAGIDPARIGLHGNNKSDAEIRRAVELGLGRIIADSVEEVERISAAAAEQGRTAKVLLRLTPWGPCLHP